MAIMNIFIVNVWGCAKIKQVNKSADEVVTSIVNIFLANYALLMKRIS